MRFDVVPSGSVEHELVVADVRRGRWWFCNLPMQWHSPHAGARVQEERLRGECNTCVIHSRLRLSGALAAAHKRPRTCTITPSPQFTGITITPTNRDLQIPVPCAAPAAAVRMSVSLKMMISYATCPICEHVPTCSPGSDGQQTGSDRENNVACGVELTSESPLVAARLDPRFMLHMSRDPGAEAHSQPSTTGSMNLSVEEENSLQQRRERNRDEQSLLDDVRDASLMQRRSTVPAGSSSAFLCTNLKHQYQHGYQVRGGGITAHELEL